MLLPDYPWDAITRPSADEVARMRAGLAAHRLAEAERLKIREKYMDGKKPPIESMEPVGAV